MLIPVIKPLIEIPRSKLLETVYYPYSVFHVEIEVRGVLKIRRKLRGYVAVDLVRNLVFLADSMPEIVYVDVDPRTVIKPRIPIEEAESRARRKMVYVSMRRYKVVLPVDVRVLNKVLAYKAFYVIDERSDRGRVLVVDSITGEHSEVRTNEV